MEEARKQASAPAPKSAFDSHKGQHKHEHIGFDATVSVEDDDDEPPKAPNSAPHGSMRKTGVLPPSHLHQSHNEPLNDVNPHASLMRKKTGVAAPSSERHVGFS